MHVCHHPTPLLALLSPIDSAEDPNFLKINFMIQKEENNEQQ